MTPPAAADLASLLQTWLPAQRWYPAKGRTVSMRVVADLTLAGPADGPSVSSPRVSLVVVDLGTGDDAVAGSRISLHVPLVAHREAGHAPPRTPDAYVGVLRTASGPVHIYDGPHDPAYVVALDALLDTAARVTSRSGWVESFPTSPPALTGESPTAGLATRSRISSRVLTGEQSNTSIIVEPVSRPDYIVKVFRTTPTGENPDITLQTALADAGSTRVARPVGYVRGGWVDGDGHTVVADLLFASEYLADAPDAWRTATQAVETGHDFVADARDLGAATAEVHLALATALPVEAVTPERLRMLADSLVARVGWAVDSAPELAEYAAASRAVMSAVATVEDAPSFQRIHGDLHLGQVLRPAGLGWILLDFEGEPLRPLAERSGLDSPLRDVAGMLRSFDYAARRVTVGLPPGAPTEAALARADAWVAAARSAYCEGYGAVSGRDPRSHPALLAALELEKALYEVVYETRNRPSWLPIPRHAVRRLAG